MSHPRRKHRRVYMTRIKPQVSPFFLLFQSPNMSASHPHPPSKSKNPSDIPTKVIGQLLSHPTYPTRTSIRLIIFNHHSQILIIHVSRHNYYKLPGGGIEDGESHYDTGCREALEESGYKVRISPAPFAKTLEYRGPEHGTVQIQTSWAYTANVVQNTARRELTEEEREDGYENLWVSVEEARRLVEECVPRTEFGKMVKEREGWFLTIHEGLTKDMNEPGETH